MRTDDRYVTGCAWLILGFGLFRMVVMGLTGPGDSESYYWAWSQRLDLAYYDHPPMVAWLIKLSTDLGGDTTFFLRLPSLILFMLMGWLIYRLSIDLFDDARIAFYSLLTFNLIPIFGIGALQMTPDIPSAICYLGFVLVINRLLVNDGPGWLWLILGVLLGIGALGKYFAILLVPSAVLLVALVPEYQKWFKRPEPYLMGVVALLIFSPVFIWNIENDWPSFRFHLMDRHQGTAFGWKNFGQLVGGQLLYVSPIYLGLLLWGVYRGAGRAVEGERRYALLTAFSLPTLLFFYIACAWTNESEPHWPAFGYLTAIVTTVSLLVEGYYRFEPKRFARFQKTAVAATLLAGFTFLLFYIHVFYPILPIKPKYDIVNELKGWDEVGNVVKAEYEKLEKNGVESFALAQHWVMCSQIMFATKDTVPVSCINGRADQFDFWDDEQSLMGKTAIFVSDTRFKEPPDTLYTFTETEAIKEIPIFRGGKEVRRFIVWRADGYGGLRK